MFSIIPHFIHRWSSNEAHIGLVLDAVRGGGGIYWKIVMHVLMFSSHILYIQLKVVISFKQLF